MISSVPFFENPDHTHCLQAVFRMILKYCLPEKDFAWEELVKITAKTEGFWTWPMAGQLWLSSHDFEVKIVEPFDYQQFVEKGADYLVEQFGEDVAQEQIKHTGSMDQEIQYARQLIKRGLAECRIPEIAEIKQQLDEGHLVICVVNSRLLNDRSGYAGHFVLLTGYEGEDFIMHDPGPPGQANRRVSIPNFERAWADPNEQAKNYVAVKLRK